MNALYYIVTYPRRKINRFFKKIGKKSPREILGEIVIL